MVEMPAEVGIARLLGMRMVRIEDRNDLKRKAKVFDSELSDGSVAYVHIKGPDEFGHDGDPVGKRRCVEAIDRDFFDLAARRLGDATLAVSCDHATPCTLGMHSSDPVPLLVTSPREGDGMRFTERNSAGGSLGRLMGKEVLDLVVKTAGETGPRVTRRPA